MHGGKTPPCTFPSNLVLKGDKPMKKQILTFLLLTALLLTSCGQTLADEGKSTETDTAPQTTELITDADTIQTDTQTAEKTDTEETGSGESGVRISKHRFCPTENFLWGKTVCSHSHWIFAAIQGIFSQRYFV